MRKSFYYFPFFRLRCISLLFGVFDVLGLIIVAMRAATPAFTIEADKPAHDVGPLFFGLITEEINHSFDGAICAELIQNRIFKDDPAAPAHWSAVRHG